MKRKIRLRFLLSIIVALLSILSYGQISQHPPEPKMKGEANTLQSTDCGDGSGIPPPPGLCVPINDYIIPFLLVGIIYGAYKSRKIEQA